ncbi:hypothetical protein EON63_11160 [archaeon]|nr:MAG: hypothetical protein EON63_11160 [archaeon]
MTYGSDLNFSEKGLRAMHNAELGDILGMVYVCLLYACMGAGICMMCVYVRVLLMYVCIFIILCTPSRLLPTLLPFPTHPLLFRQPREPCL